MSEFHLAELNIARGRFPMDAPEMRGFSENLDAINALAEASEGFVWRLKDDSGNATNIQAYEDPTLLVNLSVWASVEALKQFVFASHHKDFYVRRAEWFESMAERSSVMWWIPAGHRPSLEEAKNRLERLQSQGDGPEAFGFRNPFTPPQ